MIDNSLIGKIVVIEYVSSNGRSVRTIAILKDIKDGIIYLESPTKHAPFMVNVSAMSSIHKLDDDKVR